MCVCVCCFACPQLTSPTLSNSSLPYFPVCLTTRKLQREAARKLTGKECRLLTATSRFNLVLKERVEGSFSVSHSTQVKISTAVEILHS